MNNLCFTDDILETTYRWQNPEDIYIRLNDNNILSTYIVITENSKFFRDNYFDLHQYHDKSWGRGMNVLGTIDNIKSLYRNERNFRIQQFSERYPIQINFNEKIPKFDIIDKNIQPCDYKKQPNDFNLISLHPNKEEEYSNVTEEGEVLDTVVKVGFDPIGGEQIIVSKGNIKVNCILLEHNIYDIYHQNIQFYNGTKIQELLENTKKITEFIIFINNIIPKTKFNEIRSVLTLSRQILKKLNELNKLSEEYINKTILQELIRYFNQVQLTNLKNLTLDNYKLLPKEIYLQFINILLEHQTKILNNYHTEKLKTLLIQLFNIDKTILDFLKDKKRKRGGNKTKKNKHKKININTLNKNKKYKLSMKKRLNNSSSKTK